MVVVKEGNIHRVKVMGNCPAGGNVRGICPGGYVPIPVEQSVKAFNLYSATPTVIQHP